MLKNDSSIANIFSTLLIFKECINLGEGHFTRGLKVNQYALHFISIELNSHQVLNIPCFIKQWLSNKFCWLLLVYKELS